MMRTNNKYSDIIAYMNMMAKSLTKKIKEIENKSILVKKWRPSIINHFWWSLFVTIVRHCASVFIISHSPSNIFSSTVSSIQYVLCTTILGLKLVRLYSRHD